MAVRVKWEEVCNVIVYNISLYLKIITVNTYNVITMCQAHDKQINSFNPQLQATWMTTQDARLADEDMAAQRDKVTFTGSYSC